MLVPLKIYSVSLMEGESLPSGWSSESASSAKRYIYLKNLRRSIHSIRVFLTNIPPNTDGLLDIENANTELISIVGGKAVFKDPYWL